MLQVFFWGGQFQVIRVEVEGGEHSKKPQKIHIMDVKCHRMSEDGLRATGSISFCATMR